MSHPAPEMAAATRLIQMILENRQRASAATSCWAFVARSAGSAMMRAKKVAPTTEIVEAKWKTRIRISKSVKPVPQMVDIALSAADAKCEIAFDLVGVGGRDLPFNLVHAWLQCGH